MQPTDLKVDSNAVKSSMVVTDNDPAVDFAPEGTVSAGVQGVCWINSNPAAASGRVASLAASVWPNGEEYGPPGYINRTVHGSRCASSSHGVEALDGAPLFPDMRTNAEGMVVASKYSNGTMILAVSNPAQKMRPRHMELVLLEYEGQCIGRNMTMGRGGAVHEGLPPHFASVGGQVSILVDFPDHPSSAGGSVQFVCN